MRAVGRVLVRVLVRSSVFCPVVFWSLLFFDRSSLDSFCGQAERFARAALERAPGGRSSEAARTLAYVMLRRGASADALALIKVRHGSAMEASFDVMKLALIKAASASW